MRNNLQLIKLEIWKIGKAECEISKWECAGWITLLVKPLRLLPDP